MKMKKLLYPLFYITVGLLIGIIIGSAPRGKISKRNTYNYVNLKCLHALAKDYEASNGHFPTSLDALINWSKPDDRKIAMLEQVKQVNTAYTKGTWKLPPVDALQSNTIVITSGKLELGDGRQMEISINYAGEFTVP